MILSPKQQRMAIVRHVAALYRLPVEGILGNSHQYQYVQPRRLAMAMIKAHFDDSFPAMGRFFARDHSSVIYGMACYFGYVRQHNKTLRGAGQAITEGLAIHGETLRLEAQAIVNEAELAAQTARARNPLWQGYPHAA